MSRPKGIKNTPKPSVLPAAKPLERLDLLASLMADYIAFDYLGQQQLLKLIEERRDGKSSA